MIKWPEPVELNPAANSVMGHSDATLKQAVRDAQDVTELVEAFGKLYKKYVNLLESGRDRILDLGGSCDPVDVMEMSDPGLRDARTALSKYKGAKW